MAPGRDRSPGCQASRGCTIWFAAIGSLETVKGRPGEVRKWFDGNLLSRRGRTSKIIEARELHSRNPGSQYRLINV